MKLLTLALGLITSTSIYAQTTMCFKENHTSMMTIEKTTLDGGECSSTKSVIDMKKDGWNIDDIKIEKTTSGNNYIYIFKKEEQNLSSLDEEKLEQRIMHRLETRKKEELAQKKIDIKRIMSKNGKTMYIKQCQSCHGEKAEILSSNTSRALSKLSLQDFELSMRGYLLDDYDRGRAFIMKPYAVITDSNDIKNIYSYIKTLNPILEETK
jgi:cytochrome c553